MKRNNSEMYSVKTIQNISLEILKEFHNICERNNINYILDYGTLLGAIRHKGYIPWDDDVDVAMRRADFNKFCEIAKKELPNEMFLQTHKTDSNYYLPFAKIRFVDNNYKEKAMAHFDIKHGVWIDIFVYDFQHDDLEAEKNKRNKINKNIKFLNVITPLILPEDYENKKIKTKIKKIAIKAMIKSQKKRGMIMKYLDRKFEKLDAVIKDVPESNISNNLSTYEFFIHDGLLDTVALLNNDAFENRITVPFEKLELYIPKNYEKVLKERYGNYLELPDEDKRVSEHTWY